MKPSIASVQVITRVDPYQAQLLTPDGTALPCQAARQLPGLEFPNVKDHDVASIWRESSAFNKFRGYEWMKEPCRSCPEREKDFGGCRCQAYLLTGDPTNADPVCDLSPHHDVVLKAVEAAQASGQAAELKPLIYRNPRNSKELSLPVAAPRKPTVTA